MDFKEPLAHVGSAHGHLKGPPAWPPAKLPTVKAWCGGPVPLPNTTQRDWGVTGNVQVLATQTV